MRVFFSNSERGVASPIAILVLGFVTAGIVAGSIYLRNTINQSPLAQNAQYITYEPNTGVDLKLQNPLESDRWNYILNGDLCFNVSPPTANGRYRITATMDQKDENDNSRILTDHIIGASVQRNLTNPGTTICGSANEKRLVFAAPFNLPPKELWLQECPLIKINIETSGSWNPAPKKLLATIGQGFLCPRSGGGANGPEGNTGANQPTQFVRLTGSIQQPTQAPGSQGPTTIPLLPTQASRNVSPTTLPGAIVSPRISGPIAGASPTLVPITPGIGGPVNPTDFPAANPGDPIKSIYPDDTPLIDEDANAIEGRITVYGCTTPDTVRLNFCDSEQGNACKELPFNGDTPADNSVWFDDDLKDQTFILRYRITKDRQGKPLELGKSYYIYNAFASVRVATTGQLRSFDSAEEPFKAIVAEQTRDLTIDTGDQSCKCTFHARAFVRDADTNELIDTFDGELDENDELKCISDGRYLCGTSNDLQIAQRGDVPVWSEPFVNGVLDVYTDLYANKSNEKFAWGLYGRDGLANVRLYGPDYYDVVGQRCSVQQQGEGELPIPSCPGGTYDFEKTFSAGNPDAWNMRGFRFTCHTNVQYDWLVRRSDGKGKNDPIACELKKPENLETCKPTITSVDFSSESIAEITWDNANSAKCPTQKFTMQVRNAQGNLICEKTVPYSSSSTRMQCDIGDFLGGDEDVFEDNATYSFQLYRRTNEASCVSKPGKLSKKYNGTDQGGGENGDENASSKDFNTFSLTLFDVEKNGGSGTQNNCWLVANADGVEIDRENKVPSGSDWDCPDAHAQFEDGRPVGLSVLYTNKSNKSAPIKWQISRCKGTQETCNQDASSADGDMLTAFTEDGQTKSEFSVPAGETIQCYWNARTLKPTSWSCNTGALAQFYGIMPEYADFNSDGVINTFDLSYSLAEFGETGDDLVSDFTDDGVADGTDYSLGLSLLGTILEE